MTSIITFKESGPPVRRARRRQRHGRGPRSGASAGQSRLEELLASSHSFEDFLEEARKEGVISQPVEESEAEKETLDAVDTLHACNNTIPSARRLRRRKRKSRSSVQAGPDMIIESCCTENHDLSPSIEEVELATLDPCNLLELNNNDGPAVPRPRRHRTRKHKRSVTGAEAGLGSCCSEIHDESHSIEGTDKAVVGAGDLLAATNNNPVAAASPADIALDTQSVNAQLAFPAPPTSNATVVAPLSIPLSTNPSTGVIYATIPPKSDSPNLPASTTQTKPFATTIPTAEPLFEALSIDPLLPIALAKSPIRPATKDRQSRFFPPTPPKKTRKPPPPPLDLSIDSGDGELPLIVKAKPRPPPLDLSFLRQVRGLPVVVTDKKPLKQSNASGHGRVRSEPGVSQGVLGRNDMRKLRIDTAGWVGWREGQGMFVGEMPDEKAEEKDGSGGSAEDKSIEWEGKKLGFWV